MSFLKKLGSVVLRIVGIATGLLPLIQPVLNASSAGASKVGDKLSQAFNAIITAEQMFTAAYGLDAKKGSDKLKAAAPFVAALVQEVDLFTGKKPKDEAKFQAAVTAMTSAMADLLNSFGD